MLWPTDQLTSFKITMIARTVMMTIIMIMIEIIIITKIFDS